MVLGTFTYLQFKYPDFGFNERPVQYDELWEVFKDQGVDIIEVERDDLDKKVDPQKTKDFISYLCYGEAGISVTHPVVFLDKSRERPVKWFALAHEMGHYFLHPFLRDNMFNSDEIEKKKDYIVGRFEKEADHFANMVLLPDSMLDKYFEETVRELITKNSTCNFPQVFVDIFNRCIEITSEVIGVPIESFPKRAVLNLKFRANRYVCRIREQLLISHYDADDPLNLSLRGLNPFPHGDPYEQYMKKYVAP